MPDPSGLELWKAKDLGFDAGAGAVAAGVLLLIFVGDWLEVLQDITFNEEAAPWRLMVVSVLFMVPYKIGKRWYVKKRPTA